MNQWKNVTGFFSEEDRYYKNKYMEISEVYDEKIEVSSFSSEEDQWEVYFSFGIMYGIIYTDPEQAYVKREEVKKELAQEYQLHKEPTSEFIKAFCEKHEVSLPADIFFDASDLFGF